MSLELILVNEMIAILEKLYGVNSMAYKALNLLINTMNREKGYIRDDKSSYFTHPINVVKILLDIGIKDQNIIAAAFLHDIVEDVPGVKIYMLKVLFNNRVAELVELETKKHDVDYHADDNLVYDYLFAISKDPEASFIKLVDRIHNLSTLDYKTTEYKLKKARKTEKFFIPLVNECIKKYPQHREKFVILYEKISDLISDVKKEANNTNSLYEHQYQRVATR